MLQRRAVLSGLLAMPVIIQANRLMKLPRRPQVLGIYHPYMPLIVTSVIAKPRKLEATWTLVESDIVSLNRPDECLVLAGCGRGAAAWIAALRRGQLP